MSLKGIIFDLDGTLVDSQLDFPAMRQAVGVPEGEGILEFIGRLPSEAQKAEAMAALRPFEQAGVDCATLIPGVAEVLADIERRNLRCAVFTRNARQVADDSLARLNLKVEMVVGREDAPPKPKPDGVFKILSFWNLPGAETLMVGDYLYDLQAGAGAGTKTALYAPDGPPSYAADADFLFQHFQEFPAILDRLEGKG